MKIENPKVTLADDARNGVEEQVRSGFLDWLFEANVTGNFTYHDGTVKNLTGGRGTMSVRQWHAYPNIFPRELYSDQVLTGEKFETL